MAVKGNLSIWEAESQGVELLNSTIGDILDRQAQLTPDKEALIYNYPEIGLNLRLNFKQYREEVNKVAKGLIALGIQKGEHVAIWAINVPEWILVQLAFAKIGAVLVTINTSYRPAELEYALRQGDITTLFMTETFRKNSYLETIYGLVPELKEIADPVNSSLNSPGLPKLKRVVLFGDKPQSGTLLFSQVVALGEQLSDEVLQQRQSTVTPQDVALVMYTSGTTGFPKGAMLTHNNILNEIHCSIRGVDYSSERYVGTMPLFHIAGLSFMLSGIISGYTVISMLGFDPTKVLELIAQEKATVSFCVPTMLVAMLNHPRFLAGEFDMSSLNWIATGGTAVPVVLMEQVKEKLGADCKIFFGMTESAGGGTTTLDEDPFGLKSSTVGTPFPHLEVKIVNPTTGEAVPIGEPGELLMRGYIVMKGYYNMPEKTAETIDPEGWLHTGDQAVMNAQGYVNIVGRIKDMIIRGGENVYPAEIEQFLMRHPKVSEAQVVGVPDAYMGEEMVAFLNLKPDEKLTEAEVQQYCRANISRHKIPKYVQFVSDYPMTASGKVRKVELREQAIKYFGL